MPIPGLEDLIAFWPLDMLIGRVVADRTYFGNDGLASSGVLLEDGIRGQAYRLQIRDSLRLPLPPISTSWSLSFWFKPGVDKLAAVILALPTAGGSLELRRVQNSTQIVVFSGGAANHHSFQMITSINIWYHFLLSCERQLCHAYLNGQPIPTILTLGDLTTKEKMVFGDRQEASDTLSFEGSFDNLAVRARSFSMQEAWLECRSWYDLLPLLA
jgi:hypothetical protein